MTPKRKAQPSLAALRGIPEGYEQSSAWNTDAESVPLYRQRAADRIQADNDAAMAEYMRNPGLGNVPTARYADPEWAGLFEGLMHNNKAAGRPVDVIGAGGSLDTNKYRRDATKTLRKGTIDNNLAYRAMQSYSREMV